jgi:hypothetical protein
MLSINPLQNGKLETAIPLFLKIVLDALMKCGSNRTLRRVFQLESFVDGTLQTEIEHGAGRFEALQSTECCR